MTVVRSLLLFVLAAIAEIGGAWLVWQGVREHRHLAWVGAGIVAFGRVRVRGDLAARRTFRSLIGVAVIMYVPRT